MAWPAVRASADPVPVGVFLEAQPLFAHVRQELTLSFPDFNVELSDMTRFSPGFCLACGDGASVSLTQTTGSFSAHSIANAALGIIDADVSGSLSFTGPTKMLVIPDNSFQGAILSAPVQWSGTLAIMQPNHVFFNGTVSGSGTASVFYERSPLVGDARLGGYRVSGQRSRGDAGTRFAAPHRHGPRMAGGETAEGHVAQKRQDASQNLTRIAVSHMACRVTDIRQSTLNRQPRGGIVPLGLGGL